MTSLSVFHRLFAERAAESGYYALIGLAVVFLVLAVIWGILEIIGSFFKKKSRKRDGVRAETVTDESIVAAVTAAVFVILSEEAMASGRSSLYRPEFRVVAFRRTDGAGRRR